MPLSGCDGGGGAPEKHVNHCSVPGPVKGDWPGAPRAGRGGAGRVEGSWAAARSDRPDRPDRAAFKWLQIKLG